MKLSKVAGKQEAFNCVCVCVRVCVCARERSTARVYVCVGVLAESAVWAVLKAALRVQESPWPSARNW